MSCDVVNGFRKPGYHVTNSMRVGEIPSDDGAISQVDDRDGLLVDTLIPEEIMKLP